MKIHHMYYIFLITSWGKALEARGEAASYLYVNMTPPCLIESNDDPLMDLSPCYLLIIREVKGLRQWTIK